MTRDTATTPLTQGWQLRLLDGPVPDPLREKLLAGIPAEVPGTVHTDLLRAGLIPDPYLDENERLVGWIGECDFAYRTTFDRPDPRPWSDGHGSQRTDLVLDGLDTVATIRVNGQLVGTTRNQHRRYRFDLRDVLVEGRNDLEIEFGSALREARAAEQRIGFRPRVGNPLPYNAIRKMACNFGWDWGPVLVTAGIWRPIALHTWSSARLAEVRPIVGLEPDGTGRVQIQVELEQTGTEPVMVSAVLRDPDGDVCATTTVRAAGRAVLELGVDRPHRWWPRGHGAQPLYRLEVVLGPADEPLDGWDHQIGFRTAEVRMAPDAYGTGFEVRVNDEPIWIKGVNWIPDDCFLPRVGPEDYARGVRNAVEVGANLIRVWGGGIYEDDEFYRLCNEAGILVWQDFLFACAAYSEHVELASEVEAEARQNVARLMPNPSLVLWNGGNENVEGYYHWGWREQLAATDTWGRGYYEKLLPQIVAELDPGRSYLPSSPFTPGAWDRPRDPDHGPVHSWEVWNRRDYTAYRDDVPRFVAEFGFQGPPAWATLVEAVQDRPLLPGSPGVLAHQKAEDGNGKLSRGLAGHLPSPASTQDWHFSTQLNQARAITFGIEHFRSHWPRTTGTVLWQLNDCWPVTSWAAVDGRGRRKPLWFALRAVNADRLLTVQPREGGLALIAINDRADRWQGDLWLRRRSLDGTVKVARRLTLDVAPRANLTVAVDVETATPEVATEELLTADAPGARRAYHYFVEDSELSLSAPRMSTAVATVPGGSAVSVTAQVFLKDLVLNVDRLDPDATVDDELITLLPGESHRFVVRGAGRLEAQQWEPPVLHSVNALRHPLDRSGAGGPT